ncbi:hypothetical protein OQA88_873 [Cercophora sp. LCS_1]
MPGKRKETRAQLRARMNRARAARTWPGSKKNIAEMSKSSPPPQPSQLSQLSSVARTPSSPAPASSWPHLQPAQSSSNKAPPPPSTSSEYSPSDSDSDWSDIYNPPRSPPDASLDSPRVVSDIVPAKPPVPAPAPARTATQLTLPGLFEVGHVPEHPANRNTAPR